MYRDSMSLVQKEKPQSHLNWSRYAQHIDNKYTQA